MKSVNKNYIIGGLVILVVVLLTLVVLLIVNRPSFSFLNSSDKSENQEVSNEKKSEENSEYDNQIDINDSNQNTASDSSSNINQDSSLNENNSVSNSFSNVDTSNNTSTTSSEADVVAYFQSEADQFSTYTDQNNTSFREKAKNSFITIIDFIFYGKEIKGYTFEELTTTAKLKVIKIALTIDNKIEEYFPNYKEVIKDKYNDLKGKLAVKYLELTSSLCDTVGEDTCNQAKEDFNNMKESFSFTWSLLKELATSGKNKLKDFYENEFKN